MLSVDEAIARVLTGVGRLPAELIPLAEAHGRILAADVVSAVDVPHWDVSAMDGYAVRAADVGATASLRITGTIAAGDPGDIPVEPGCAVRIMTGAPMPPGADAVVLWEDSDRAQRGDVRLNGPIEPGANLRLRGEDVHTGDVVFRAGEKLTAGRLGVCAALGFAELAVVRRPRVAVLATGDELREPGEPLARGEIWSSNPYTIAALAREAGAEVQVLPRCGDDLRQIVAALRSVDDVDAIVITGGVSGGDFDFTREALAQVGVALDLWKVKMKPGKPVAIGRWPDGPTVFGLPGNPVSCAVTFQVFVRPWLLTRLGVNRPFLPVIDAFAGTDLPSGPGRARFERVTLRRDAGVFSVASAGSSSSGVLSAYARAHGLMLLPPESPGPRAGEVVRVMVLDPGFLDEARGEYGF